MADAVGGPGEAAALAGHAARAGALRRFLFTVYAAGIAVLVATGDDWYPVLDGREPVEWDEWLSLAALGLMVVVVMSSGRVVRLQRELRDEADQAASSERQLLATTREWVWSVSSAGVCTSSSTAIRTMLGRDPEAIVGADLLELLHADDRAETAARLRELADAKQGWTGWVRRWQHHDGTFRWLESDAVAVLDEHGSFLGFRGADRDVTEEVLRRHERAQTLAAAAAKRSRVAAVLGDPQRSLAMVYQPIVALDDGTIAGAEALARFPGPLHRGPDRWFAEAVEVGLGEELEILAVRQGLAGITALGGAYVSVNVSPATLLSPSLLAALADRSVPTDRVVVELTEHVEFSGYDDLRDALAALRQLGVRIAVDDAGAGYASFQHILELRPDFIKLDRGIVRGVAVDPVRRALASAVADFARDISATVIAEGVEEADEVLALRAAGVTYGQGYYFAAPGPLPLPHIPPPPHESGGRVVIVDDDPVVRLLVTTMARRAGLDVVGQASDGREGLALLDLLRPDVVVLDLSMPVLDGVTALPQVRALLPDATIVVLSALGGDGVVRDALLSGADAFVAKAESVTQLPKLLGELREPTGLRVRAG